MLLELIQAASDKFSSKPASKGCQGLPRVAKGCPSELLCEDHLAAGQLHHVSNQEHVGPHPPSQPSGWPRCIKLLQYKGRKK